MLSPKRGMIFLWLPAPVLLVTFLIGDKIFKLGSEYLQSGPKKIGTGTSNRLIEYSIERPNIE